LPKEERGRKASEKQRWRNLSARPLSVSVQPSFAQMSVRVRTSDPSNNIKVVGQQDRYIKKKQELHVHYISFQTNQIWILFPIRPILGFSFCDTKNLENFLVGKQTKVFPQKKITEIPSSSSILIKVFFFSSQFCDGYKLNMKKKASFYDFGYLLEFIVLFRKSSKFGSFSLKQC
jgi:hypothetical protein